MVDFTTPTRSQLLELIGDDQRLIIAFESLFSVASNISEMQDDIEELQAKVAALESGS